MKTTSTPWDDLDIPSVRETYVVKMVNDELNPSSRRVFWAKSFYGNSALLVDYSCKPWKPISIPMFKNFRIEDHRFESCLSVELLDADMSDLFYKVCLDVIAALQPIDLSAARDACILRLEKWSALLKPSRNKLSPEEQKGLIAELRFLGRDAFEVCAIDSALDCWTGPEFGPRDFAFGQVFVEVKSKRSSANTEIVISSEEQLNVNPSEQLFLYVTEFNNAPADEETAVSLNDVVNETRELLDTPLQVAMLDAKLTNVGFCDEDDYSDSMWTQGESYYYAVVGDFPKIGSSDCPTGVSRVSYQIDLDECEEYCIDRQNVLDSLE